MEHFYTTFDATNDDYNMIGLSYEIGTDASSSSSSGFAVSLIVIILVVLLLIVGLVLGAIVIRRR